MPSTSEDFNPAENATAKLMWHITEKGFQLGSCVGVAIAAPVSAYRRRHSGIPLSPRLLRALSRSAFVGTALSGKGDAHGSVRGMTAALQDNVQRVITPDHTGLLGAEQGCLVLNRAAWC